MVVGVMDTAIVGISVGSGSVGVRLGVIVGLAKAVAVEIIGVTVGLLLVGVGKLAVGVDGVMVIMDSGVAQDARAKTRTNNANTLR
jgi:hypothetical protein